MLPRADSDTVVLTLGDDEQCRLNDWSFGQLCRMSGISKDTIGQLSPETASLALRETLARGRKADSDSDGRLKPFARCMACRTRVCGTRTCSTSLRNTQPTFSRLRAGFNGATGLYCGEQDLFAFLIDPEGWVEIDDQAFAPGFFVWNSEVGRRTLGIQTFWFQAICQNHIVWDATEVVEFTRKHTASVQDGLIEIGRMIERLVAQRDARRDGFFKVIRSAMSAQLGQDADEVLKSLLDHGIPRGLSKEAVELTKTQGRFTVFALVDALTRLTQRVQFAGDRVELDHKAAALLALAA